MTNLEKKQIVSETVKFYKKLGITLKPEMSVSVMHNFELYKLTFLDASHATIQLIIDGGDDDKLEKEIPPINNCKLTPVKVATKQLGDVKPNTFSRRKSAGIDGKTMDLLEDAIIKYGADNIKIGTILSATSEGGKQITFEFLPDGIRTTIQSF